MRFNKMIFMVLVFAVLVFSFSGIGFAFPGYGGRGMMNHYMGSRFYNLQEDDYNPLNLDEQQKELVSEIREEFLKERIELQIEIRELNLELRESLLLNGTDEEVANLKTKLNILQNDLLNAKTGYWQGMQEILNSEQLEKMKELLENQEYSDNNIRRPRGFRGQHMAGMGFFSSGRAQSTLNNICPFAF